MTKVTVLLTSYNHGPFVGRSIQSVLNQTFSDFELLIVDDCSQDDSWEVICSYHDSRITAVRNERNMGPEHAFAIMQQRAKSQYVAIFHSDDLWYPDKLEKQVTYLDEHPDIAAVFTAVEVIGEDDEARKDIQDVYTNAFKTENRSRFEWLNYFFYNGNCLCHPSVLIRREMYELCGMKTGTMAQIPDYYKWVRLLQRYDIHILGERLTRYRVLKNEQNTSAPTLTKQVRSLTELYFLFETYFELNDADILKVFPQAQRYRINGEINGKYALARIFVEEGNCMPIRFLGLERLARLLDGPDGEQIQRLYGYDFLRHIALTGKVDVFSLQAERLDAALAENRVQLYWDAGEGFCPENCINVAYVADSRCGVQVSVDIPEQRPLRSLRLDPCDGHCAIVALRHFCADGVNLLDDAQSNGVTQGNVQIFTHTDPQYVVSFAEPRAVRHIEAELFLSDRMQYALTVEEAWRTPPFTAVAEPAATQTVSAVQKGNETVKGGLLGRLLHR